jgi:hypothetical protein
MLEGGGSGSGSGSGVGAGDAVDVSGAGSVSVRRQSGRRKGCRHGGMARHGDGMAWHSSSSSSLDAAWGSMRACMQVPLADQIPGNNTGCQCGEGVLGVGEVRCRKLWICCKSFVQPRTSSSTTMRLLRASCHRSTYACNLATPTVGFQAADAPKSAG